MSKKSEVENAAPATETSAGEQSAAINDQSTPAATVLSSAVAALDMGDITIGQQTTPAPGGVIPGDDPSSNEPPTGVSGIDADKKRGRGRPPESEEVKKAKATAKAAADKSGARQPRQAITPGAATLSTREPSPDARGGAALIMQSLDFVREVISDGEVDKGISPEEITKRGAVRSSVETAWATYLDDCGSKLPPWAVVVVLSGVYIAPALRTPTAREKLGFAWLKMREWMKKKMGKE